ncbi:MULTISPECIES: hypothetical protein [unclassified Streptomyces]|uniref:hypothetical protein n=1 Tax=unclassified Streptomyces TaxID=2593676 RepID=UPI001BE84AAD|nr:MULTISPECIES: hypothetical protein [unclassified Streptomyces]MBT2403633.1 hypothetical protein [Streptomyces sp. ISL-21]MBT2609828.1 hypothetical protein [Streptomyces sp. ISL-87]
MRRLGSAVEAVLRYRRPDPWCWEVVVAAVCGRETHWDADDAMVQAGRAVSVHADRIAESLGKELNGFVRSGHTIKVHALALAGMGDLRALPALRRLAKDDQLPSERPLAHLLAPLPAADLLPAVLPALRREPAPYQASTFTLELLAAWGPAAAPAVPEVVRHLDTPYAYDALRVLGRIGPPAAAVADQLAAFATGRAPQTGRHHPRRAAWAHWRVTGDPTLALDVCGKAVGSGTAGHGLPFLADLGPLAAAHADTVRGLMESPGAWTRVAAAHAYWRITGDPEPAVPVLLAAVDPAWTGLAALPVREAVRHLGEIGAPAAAAAPLLPRILAAEERLSYPFAGVRILADEAYTRTLTEALERIGPSADDPVRALVPRSGISTWAVRSVSSVMANLLEKVPLVGSDGLWKRT